MTPADTVRKAVAEACEEKPHFISPSHNLALLGLDPGRVRRWKLLASITPEMPVSTALTLQTVSDLIRYVEAREAQVRG